MLLNLRFCKRIWRSPCWAYLERRLFGNGMRDKNNRGKQKMKRKKERRKNGQEGILRFSEISEVFVNKNLVQDYHTQLLFCVYQYIFFSLLALPQINVNNKRNYS